MDKYTVNKKMHNEGKEISIGTTISVNDLHIKILEKLEKKGLIQKIKEEKSEDIKSDTDSSIDSKKKTK